MDRWFLLALAFVWLALALRAAPVPSNKYQAPPEWEVASTATGGELGNAEVKIKIAAKAGEIKATQTRISEKGEVSKTNVMIPAAAAAKLWATMAKVNALELPNSSVISEDALDYTIDLAWSGKSRIIQVKGSSPARHLELTLAIERCFAAGEKAQAPREWELASTATGGELGKAEVKIKITAKAGEVQGTRTRTSEKGEVSKTQVVIPAAAAAQLWQTMAKVNAWELGDFAKLALDAPNFTLGLAWGGKSRTIHVKGYSQSPNHLELILAIQKCFDEGGAK